MTYSKDNWNRFLRLWLPVATALSSTLTPEPATALSIVPIGDSITQGYHACSYRTKLIESLDNVNNLIVVTFDSSIHKPSGICSTTNGNHEGHGGRATTNTYLNHLATGTSYSAAYLNANTPDVLIVAHSHHRYVDRNWL